MRQPITTILIAMPNRRSRKGKKKNRDNRELSPNVLTYLGPINSPLAIQEMKCYTTILHASFSAASSSGGVLNNVFGSSPGSSTQWASLSGSFDEFRTLGFQVKYVPLDRYDLPVSVGTVPIFIAVDRDANTPFASIGAATGYESCEMKMTSDPWTKKAGMSSVTEAQFTASSTPSSFYWIKVYSQGLAVSSSVGYFLVTYRVQFRGVGF